MNNTGKKFGGRKAGVKNKELTDVRAKFQLLIDNNIDALQSDLDCLKPLDRVKVIIDLAKFCIPTLKAIDSIDTAKTTIREPITFRVIENKDQRELMEKEIRLQIANENK
jgi:hypothetical protein